MVLPDINKKRRFCEWSTLTRAECGTAGTGWVDATLCRDLRRAGELIEDHERGADRSTIG